MNFVINNIGWFVGTFFVIVLALIGYYADKKEKETNMKENVKLNSKKTIEELNNQDNTFDNQINDIQENKLNNINEENIKENPIYDSMDNLNVEEQLNNIGENMENKFNQEIVIPEFKNMESLNISLEDLEKKNYNDILDKKIKNEELLPDFTNSGDYLDETLAELNEFDHAFDNEVEQTINDHERVIETEDSEITNPNTDQNNQNVDETNNNQEQTINDELEQPEIQNENNDIWGFNNDQNGYNQGIPELFSNYEPDDNNESEIKHWEKLENTAPEESSNLYNNTTDEDIWKF